MPENLLFQKKDIYVFVEEQQQRIRQAYESLSDEQALDEGVIERLKKQFNLDVPVLQRDKRTYDDHPLSPGGAGVEYAFYVPFEGDPKVFDIAPSAFDGKIVSGTVVGQELVLRFVVRNPNIRVQELLDRELAIVELRLFHLRGSTEYLEQQLNITLSNCKVVRRRVIEDRAKMLAIKPNLPRRANAEALQDPPKTISSVISKPLPFRIDMVAKTLAEIKTLPTSEQDMLLLRRLVHIYPQMRSAGGLHKGNLLLNGDPYGLGLGLSDTEKAPILLHLLGTPWTHLVNAGFLIDPAGTGFFAPTDEGISAASAPERKSKETKATSDPRVPTAFMSYSWDTPEHKQWVLRLAERLRSEGGVNVILDQWHLPIGGDRTYFMENSIRESDFVLLVCTPLYAQKSNGRSGGVGYEATILTGQLARHITQNKFIPVLRLGEWDDSAIPIWLQTKIGVDFRTEPRNEEQYQLLLRALHQAQEQVPPIGPRPNFQAPTIIQAGGLLGNAVTPILEPVSTGTQPAQSGLVGAGASRSKQSPIAYAFYERKGTDAKVQVFVRPIDSTEDLYSFETTTGEYEEGTAKHINLRYLSCDLSFKEDGYTRMQSFNGAGGQRFTLP